MPETEAADLRAELAEMIHIRKAMLRGRMFDPESSDTDAWVEVNTSARSALARVGFGVSFKIEGVELRFHEVPDGPLAQLVLRNHGLTRVMPLIVMPLIGADHGTAGLRAEVRRVEEDQER